MRPRTFADGMLGGELLIGAGLGLLFVPISLVGLTRVDTGDTGVASSLVNVGQQVGGAIGLAIVGTAAWSAMASNLRSAAAQAGAHPSAAQAAALQARIYHHALAAGFSRGYLVSAGILMLALIIALFVMRVTRADLSGAGRRQSRPVTPARRTWREARKPRRPDLPAPAVSQHA